MFKYEALPKIKKGERKREREGRQGEERGGVRREGREFRPSQRFFSGLGF